jgi:signal transduction histidine kinase
MTARELEELAAGAALYAKQGAALSVRADTDAGWRTMEALVREAADMRTAEEAKLNAATRSWQADYRLARWVSSSGAVLNIGLVILASALVYADVRWRVRQAIALRSQKRELEREVAARTQELAALSTHLQGVSEQEKSALSRELHDELGGLLVAASMDLSWLEQRLPSTDPGILQRFQRIHESLSAGVDLKRRVVEELRPTLLDNMGLFAALRWQFKETCRRAGLLCVETIPEAEMKFHPDASIGIFRIAQEALTNILKHAKATRAELHVVIEDDVFLLRVSDNGAGIPPNPPHQALSHGLASMRHRVSALGGRWDIRSFPAGGTVLTATIPLGRLLSA